jgi:hypothetical protein
MGKIGKKWEKDNVLYYHYYHHNHRHHLYRLGQSLLSLHLRLGTPRVTMVARPQYKQYM